MISKLLKGVSLTALLIASITLTACSSSAAKAALGKSSDARLSNIVLTGASLDNEFQSDTRTYDAELDSNESPTVTISVEKINSGQSVAIDGVTTETSSLTVSDSSKTCTIAVTSEDGTRTKNYTVTIRKKTTTDTNAYLGSLSVTGLSISPDFSKTGLTYSATVGSSVTAAVINFEKDSSTASVLFNGTETAETSRTVELASGSNSFVIRVISGDKSAANNYTVTIVRTSTYDTSLSSLSVSSGTIKDFISTTLSYTASTSESSFTVTPTAASADASITVNDQAVTSGSASQSFSFTAAGETKTVTIKVSLGGASTSYTLVMTYTPVADGNAYLSALETSAGTLSFGKQTFAYTGYTVESSVETITVTPTAEESTASITVDGVASESGKAATVALAKGEDSLVDITVKDGTKSHTYLIVVTRKGEGSTITGVWVNAYIPSTWGWSGVYIHYWTAAKTYTTWLSCPAMTAAGNDWYSFNVTEVSTVNALIKGAAGNPSSVQKSTDQSSLTGDVYISCPASTWINSTTRPEGAPSHQGWTAPAKPVFTFNPDGGDILSGGSVTITAAANSTGATIASSGYLLNGVKVTNLDPFTLTADAKIVAFAKNSEGGADVASKSFTATSATAPKITLNPTSGSFTDSIDVTVTTTNTTAKYSSIDGGAWTTFTGSALSIGSSKAAGESITLQIKAVNSATGEETLSPVCTYTKKTAYTATFSWRNANVYFVMTDRFNNGDTSNDHSYGRSVGEVDASSYATRQGTFHGGDIKGLTAKLDYLESLGINAIWVTAPYEQIHGALTATGFKHYAYHGYYALDFTGMDKNMGTVEEFRAFVNAAHAKGIRVIMDVVMNHVGYANPVDANEYGYGALASNWQDIYYNWSESNYKWYNDYAGEASSNGSSGMMLYDGDWITNYWGTNWIRLVGTRFKGYDGTEGNSLTQLTGGLPDFKTENTSAPGLAGLMKIKWAREAAGFDNWIIPAAKSLRKDTGMTVTENLTSWLAAWVEEFGIDGFRCDTAKHIEKSAWKTLKTKSNTALAKWRSNNSTLDAAKWTDSFWMTGEHYDWTINITDSYFTEGGFDSMINFGFPKDGNLSSIGATWSSYANTINTSTNNALSYISSHDKGLTRSSMINQGTCLLLAPGGVQVYYGDETERAASVSGEQGWRSQMTFDTNAATLAHWKKIGTFRNEHVAVGAGTQTALGSDTYGRSYTTSAGAADKVVIKINASGSTSVSVAGFFDNGTTVKNHYDGTTATVANGSVTFTASNGVILIEAAE